MKKLSKSELSTPEMEERARIAGEVLNNKRSKHFTVGTYILCAGKRGLVIAEGGRISDGRNLIIVEWEDGSQEELMPRALNPGGLGHEV